MRRQLVIFGVALLALCAMASPAAATTSECNAVVTGGSFKNLVVPRDGSCTLNDSTVTGDVRVKRGAYFQATNTDIAGKVTARDAQTLFIDTGSSVGESVRSHGTIQVFVFNATVARDVDVEHTTEVAQVCGTNVGDDLEVERSGFDILIGDPQAVDCAGNTVGDDLEAERNTAEVEFVGLPRLIKALSRIVGLKDKYRPQRQGTPEPGRP